MAKWRQSTKEIIFIARLQLSLVKRVKKKKKEVNFKLFFMFRALYGEDSLKTGNENHFLCTLPLSFSFGYLLFYLDMIITYCLCWYDCGISGRSGAAIAKDKMSVFPTSAHWLVLSCVVWFYRLYLPSIQPTLHSFSI